MTYTTLSFRLFFISMLMVVSCQKEDQNLCLHESGILNQKTIPLEEFHAVHLYLNAEVTIHPADKHHIHLKGDSTLLQQITTEVENKTLKIENQFDNCNSLNALKISVGLPHLRHLLTTKKNRIQLHPFSSMQGWNIHLTDHSTLDFVAGDKLKEMNVHLSRGAKVVCKNTSPVSIDQLTLNVLGKGHFDGYAIEAKEAHVRFEGSGWCKVHAQEKLDVIIYGDAMVYCKGMPHFYKRITGSGKVYFTN